MSKMKRIKIYQSIIINIPIFLASIFDLISKVNPGAPGGTGGW